MTELSDVTVRCACYLQIHWCRLVTTEEENKKLKMEMSELKARLKVEMDELNRKMEKEMEQVHERSASH